MTLNEIILAAARANANTKISEIDVHIKKFGGIYNSWYVGISDDPKRRLFQEHLIIEDKDIWIWTRCQSSLSARLVEDYFVNRLVTDGGVGGGDGNSTYVYAYRKTSTSRP